MTIKRNLFIYISIILFVSFFTYFKNYQNPPQQFWDENYHVASAQKYINGVFFLEPHPPLGKLFIALGEKILHPNDNIDTNYFTKTDFIKKFPKDYSFKGVRLFPTLFAWMNSILFFLILYLLTKKPFLSFLGSFFYIFDNALIVHSRSAMLESTQLFFIFLSIITFLYIYKKEQRTYKDYFIFTVFLTLSTMVKLNSLVLLLLYIWLFYKDYKVAFIPYKFINKIVIIALTMFVTTFFVFFIHNSISTKIVGNKLYGLTPKIINQIKQNNFSTLDSIREYYFYMKRYEKTVPKYNPCKKGENGSLAMTWPLIDKTINYRWQKENNKTSYLYLIGNPIIWFLGLIGILSSIILVGGKYLYNLKVKKEKFTYIFIFTALYISYMIAILKLERVMYLYHYFIPLIFSLILFILQIDYIFDKELQQKNKILYLSLSLLFLLVVYTYWFFSPLTYYQPMDLIEFNKRAWFDFWHLKAIL